MGLIGSTRVLGFLITFENISPIRIGGLFEDELADAPLMKTPDGRFVINGRAWRSLLRRSLKRLNTSKLLCLMDDSPNAAVSAVWLEHSFIRSDTAYRTGISIDERTCTVNDGGVYSYEVLPTGTEGIILKGKIYYSDASDTKLYKQELCSALKIIESGVETIGGNWGYGFGRLKPVMFEAYDKDISETLENEFIEEFADFRINDYAVLEYKKSWLNISIKCSIPDGQLFGIHQIAPRENYDPVSGEYPDNFVFTEKHFGEEKPIVTGKAFRQVVLKKELSRKLKSMNTDNADNILNSLFGTGSQRGVVSVMDSAVIEAKVKEIRRIQLAETSFKNMNLFFMEYLMKGTFTTSIIVDAEGDLRDHILDFILEIKEFPEGAIRMGGDSRFGGIFVIEEVTCHE